MSISEFKKHENLRKYVFGSFLAHLLILVGFGYFFKVSLFFKKQRIFDSFPVVLLSSSLEEDFFKKDLNEFSKKKLKKVLRIKKHLEQKIKHTPKKKISSVSQNFLFKKKQDAFFVSSSLSKTPVLLKRIKPHYPFIARQNHWAGTTVFSLYVQNGRVKKIKIIQSSGHVVLDQSAQKALMKWQFPLSFLGVLRQKVTFRLEKNAETFR